MEIYTFSGTGNSRYIQQHTDELCERLGAHREIEVGWVGMKPQ